jgi:hypothetical protein
MAEYPSQDEFTAHAQRLLRYRIPLVLGLLVNCVLIARVPLSQMRAASGPRSDQQQIASLDPVAATAGAEQESNSNGPHPLHTETPEAVDLAVSPATSPSERVAQLQMEMPTGPADIAVPPVDTQITLPTTSATDVVAAERPILEMPSTLPLSKSQMDLSWASEGLTSGLTRVSEFWQNSFGDVVHQSDLANATQVADEPLIVDVPSVADSATSTTQTQVPAAPSRRLELENPQDSGGAVHLLVDGRRCTLLVGESHLFPAETPHCIQFHRGGDFGNDEVCLTGGRFQFKVTDGGWQLIPVE